MVSLGAISAEDVNVTVISDSQVDNSVYVDSNIVANGNGTINNPISNIKKMLLI